MTVTLDADSRVQKDRTTYNIVGEIPGRHPGRRILLSAHYDSYFDGFQDDNTAVSMMLSIAAALRKIGYEPENTLTFCAMAAEVCVSAKDAGRADIKRLMAAWGKDAAATGCARRPGGRCFLHIYFVLSTNCITFAFILI